MTAPVSPPAVYGAREKLIVALDVDSAAGARAIVEELAGGVGAFKIGMQLFTAAGPEFVREMAGRGHRVFLDLKYHDIPNTVAQAGVEAARLGAWMFNVHASGGGEMMKRTAGAVAEACERESLKQPLMIAVTVLTSSNADTLNETGISGTVEEQVGRLARLTAASGFHGVVASPLETSYIKSLEGCSELVVVTPGVRPESATLDDQKRVTTPGAAAANGSDFLVIGRPITGAANRRAAAEAVIAEIQAALG